MAQRPERRTRLCVRAGPYKLVIQPELVTVCPRFQYARNVYYLSFAFKVNIIKINLSWLAVETVKFYISMYLIVLLLLIIILLG